MINTQPKSISGGIIFVLFCLLFILNYSCRKTDSQFTTQSFSSNEDRFFNSRRSSEPLTQLAITILKRQNEKYPFVEKTVKQIGYPYWNKALVITLPSGSGRSASDSMNIIYIPFVRDSQNYVNASLIIKMDPVDTSFWYLCDWQYSNFGFDSTTEGWSARDIFHVFARMDQSVFGRNRFKIKDRRLLTADDNALIDSMGLSFDSASVIYRLEPSQNSGRNNVLSLVTWCDDVHICVQPHLLGFRNSLTIVSDPSCTGTGLALNGLLCTSTWVDIPGSGGGTTGGGGGTTGGGSGSGSGPGSPPNNPCNPVTTRLELTEGCSPGWENPPAPTVTQQLTAWDNAIIIDRNLRPCVKAIIDKVKQIEAGAIAKMIKLLSGSIPHFDWTIKEGSTINPNADAETIIGQNGDHSAVTTLNQIKLANATDISMARTILHEAIHAFIYDYVYNNNSLSAADKAQILNLPFEKKIKKYFTLIFSTSTNAEHNAMVKDFHDDMKEALKALCPSLGITLTGNDLDLFCNDMAWGGLQDNDPNSPWMDSNILLDEDRERITKRLDIELNNLPGFSGTVNGYYISLSRIGTKACP